MYSKKFEGGEKVTFSDNEHWCHACLVKAEKVKQDQVDSPASLKPTTPASLPVDDHHPYSPPHPPTHSVSVAPPQTSPLPPATTSATTTTTTREVEDSLKSSINGSVLKDTNSSPRSHSDNSKYTDIIERALVHISKTIFTSF